ncbi:hypothetical protein RCL1_004161 [Eukaryota sp. TZLM3-RCL]
MICPILVSIVLGLVTLLLLFAVLSFFIVRDSIHQFLHNDPAASSSLLVFLTYPGVHALLFHRIANFFFRNHIPFIAHILAYIGRFLTGIEIHPGATIGRGLMIDHGTATVIGETTIIGDRVTIYSSVVLGGRKIVKNPKSRRHPLLKDNCIIGAGASVLGPITIGEGAKIGSNAVVLSDVADRTTVVGVPARECTAKSPNEDCFDSYAASANVDPFCMFMKIMIERVSKLEDKLSKLTDESSASESEDHLQFMENIKRFLSEHCRKKLE